MSILSMIWDWTVGLAIIGGSAATFYFVVDTFIAGLAARNIMRRIKHEQSEEMRRQSVDAAFRTTGQKILRASFQKGNHE